MTADTLLEVMVGEHDTFHQIQILFGRDRSTGSIQG